MSPRTRTHCLRTGATWAATVLALALATGGCTLLLDSTSVQCNTDQDCAQFPGQLICLNHVCASPASCLPFDNCDRLQLCQGATDDSALIPPQAPDAGTATTGGGSTADAGGGPTLPRCVDEAAGRGNPVYVTGSSNFPPLFSKVAPLMLAKGYTPIYQITSSCNGVRTMLGTGARDHLMIDPAPGSTGQPAAYYNMDGVATPCSLGANGVTVDVGESDIYSSSCAGFSAPSGNVGEFLGPIQAMLFVVPNNSQQQTISREAARAVFGRGGDGGKAAPWTNPILYFIRNANTGTQQMIGRAIGVPADSFWGIDRGTARNVDALMRAVTEFGPADEAIGIISTDFYDADRGNIRALAFQDAGQSCGFFPDSTLERRDKRNVRDGSYPIWGPLHLYATVNNGLPVNAGPRDFVSLIGVPNVEKVLLDNFIASSLVPPCAMMVHRDTELGPLSSFAPSYMCGCYFESQADLNGQTPEGCTPCSTAEDCSRNDPRHPACNLGFCESK